MHSRGDGGKEFVEEVLWPQRAQSAQRVGLGAATIWAVIALARSPRRLAAQSPRDDGVFVF